mmetsp:Transcript_30368/g.55032  ORF Transcript_30368/g.55032 Transcript_30368/m.55032 type:complete len:289 (-) Transcript_30368:2262-3128(-)
MVISEVVGPPTETAEGVAVVVMLACCCCGCCRAATVAPGDGAAKGSITPPAELPIDVAAGAAATGEGANKSLVALTTAVGCTGIWENMSNPPPPPTAGVEATGAAGCGGAEKISERRSTSLCASAGAAAAELPFCFAGAGTATAPPPPNISSKSKRLGSPPPPPPEEAGTDTAASSASSPATLSNGSIISPCIIIAPLRSSLFLRINFTSTTGMRANASFAALITVALTLLSLPPAPPPPPKMSSSPPPSPFSARFLATPRMASINAPYSHDRSCSSSSGEPSCFRTN